MEVEGIVGRCITVEREARRGKFLGDDGRLQGAFWQSCATRPVSPGLMKRPVAAHRMRTAS
jgi:hypothetical protein